MNCSWGFGITDRLSAHVGAALSADGHFMNGDRALEFGLFGTVLDSDSFDLDLFLGFAGADGGSFTAAPACELNWDASPDLDRWGLYSRAGLAITGRNGLNGPDHAADLEMALEAYWTLAAGRQILLEFDGAFVDADPGVDPAAGGHGWDTGGIAFGYNTEIAGSMEMINQVYWNLPHHGEDGYLGIMIGFVATLPAGP